MCVFSLFSSWRIFHVIRRQKMKRKGRNAVGKLQDSCDVWLDPSALKRRKVMNVATKSPLTLLGQKSHRPAAIIGPPHPCTKQTTISTFFTAQKAGTVLIFFLPSRNNCKVLMTWKENCLHRNNYQFDSLCTLHCNIHRPNGPSSFLSRHRQIKRTVLWEKPTEPNKQLMTSASNNVVNLKDSELLRGERTRAWASVLQPSSLQDRQRQPAKAATCNSLPARAQSHASSPPVAQKAFLTTDLIQHLEEKGPLQQQVAPVSPLKKKNDGWQREESPALFSQRSPSLKIISNQRADAEKRRRLPSSWVGATFVDSSDSENMDPELEENLPEAAYLDFNQTGSCRKYTSYENSSLVSTQRLFTQDSEGCRVILHRPEGEGSQPSLPKALWWGKRTPVRSAFNNRSCFRDGWAGDRRPPGSLGRRGVPPLTEHSEKSCYDLLFTEDSEGNKVIKH
ncbi:aurora kinase A and ninein-interacting protein-like [Ahaetulla prasina]|uniref:aurora kinase A and ninein-interacting protein-like n=1 Tax=Ahaetulla prasina TaxID=499056 RepID=UPI0026474DDE|nr:aurora kinase A and ninein-interacting protein-like [Ahaetulla prasina]